MGLRSALRLAAAASTLPNTSSVILGGGDVAAVSTLPAEVAAAFGISTATESITRAEAMTVPAVRRGRQVIAGTIGTLDLVALRDLADGTVEPVDRTLLEQPDPSTTRQHVLTWTVDDLMFSGIAWWRVLDRDPQGYPTRAEHLAPWRVSIVHTDRGTGRQVLVDGHPVADGDLIRFDGPDEGVLRYGARVLRTCILLDQAVRRFATLDVPLGVLKLAEGATELSVERGSAGDGTDASEVDALLDAWETARRNRSTAYLNRAVEYDVVAFDAQRVQLAEARQYQAAEVARLLALPPSYVNAPQASGMTYNNRETERSELGDTLAPYTTAIEQRLSLGDVTPRGQVVRFDLTKLTRGTTKDVVDTAAVAIPLGLLTEAEVRTKYLGLPPIPSSERPTA